MNTMKLPLFIVLVLFPVLLSFSQEEDFAEFEKDLREHFNDLEEDLNEELGSMIEDEGNLLAEIQQARAAGENREIASLEIELVRIRVGLNEWKALSAKHQEIMALKGEEFVEQEGPFSRAFENAHRKRDIAETKAKVSYLQMDLEFLGNEEEPDDGEAFLNRELKQAQAELQGRLALYEGWQKVNASRNEGRDEEADKMERQLWVKEQDLAFQIESTEIRHRAAEARERTEELRQETALAQREVKMSMELLKQRQELREIWQKAKEDLANANDEDFGELLEEYHHVETKYQMKREMMEVRFNLFRAEAFEDEDMIDEFQRILEELEEEARELE